MSSVFPVMARIAEDLQAVEFPPHPVTNRAPSVSIGQDETTRDEQIVVRLRTDDDPASLAWASMGAGGREQRYIVDVWALSSIAGRTWADMWERLEVLVEAVLAVFTNDSGQFLPPGGVDPDDGNEFGIFHGMAADENHNQWANDEGWHGECRVAVSIAARI